MSIFGRQSESSRPTETFTPARIAFVGEQIGPVEDKLKVKFCEVLALTPSVESAYLARVSYDDVAGYSVALCIRSKYGENDHLQKVLAQIFADTFNPDQHLDTLFIRHDQEQELKKVCQAFYVAA